MDNLKKQIRSVKKAMGDYGIATIIMAVFYTVAVIVSTGTSEAIYVVLISLISAGVCLYLVYMTVSCLGLYHGCNKITSTSAVPVEIKCKSIKLRGVAMGKTGSELIGIIFVADNGKKYVYILPEREGFDSKLRRKYNEAFVGASVTLAVYKDTNYVYKII